MLGDPPPAMSREPTWNVCLMCVLAAEDALEAFEEGFTLGPRLPNETHGGRYCVKQRPTSAATSADTVLGAPVQYESMFRRTDDSPTRWF